MRTTRLARWLAASAAVAAAAMANAWIWRPNPAGMFADFNPDVARCPA